MGNILDVVETENHWRRVHLISVFCSCSVTCLMVRLSSTGAAAAWSRAIRAPAVFSRAE